MTITKSVIAVYFKESVSKILLLLQQKINLCWQRMKTQHNVHATTGSQISFKELLVDRFEM